MVRLSSWGLAIGLGLAALEGCSSSDRPPALREDVGSAGGQGGTAGGSQGGAGPIIDPRPSIASNCGYEAIDAHREPVRLYAVVDRSGSMSDLVGKNTKYAAVRAALVKLVERIGWRSEVGAALFPGPSADSGCVAGTEVFAPREGDPRTLLEQGVQGPVTKAFAKALAVNPQGGTPTGKTLQALLPRLTKLGANAYVLLATDGGPNCNESLSCSAQTCMPNLEKAPGCTDAYNCCDPQLDPNFTGLNCLDGDGTLSAVLSLAQAGIKTLVVGIPGSAPYATLLDQLAVAGGTPRPGDTRYYRVDDLDTLESLLLSIGSEILVSCDLTLASPPADPLLVNVLLDEDVVPADPASGWEWSGETTISLRGPACERLLSGDVDKVQVVVGCPTQALE